jgi:drug/metabolite transporter (DMT)-like permease
MRPERRQAITLGAFLVMVVLIGANLVAVRFSNRELAPFWGASVRFFASAALLGAVVGVRRLPIPRRSQLLGTLGFGVLNFAGFFAFAYWALQELPAAIAGVMFASVPLLTFFLAIAHRQERFRWRSLLGGLVVVAGIAVMARAPVNADVPLLNLAAMFGAAVCAAEVGIIARHFREVDPVVMNAIGMTVGAVILLVLSFVAVEVKVLPSDPDTIWSLAYLIVPGSCGVFLLYLFILKTWTASAASYEFVLAPISAALLGAWLLDEPLTAQVGLGGVIVLAGVYVGALREQAVIPSTDGPIDDDLVRRLRDADQP